MDAPFFGQRIRFVCAVSFWESAIRYMAAMNFGWRILDLTQPHVARPPESWFEFNFSTFSGFFKHLFFEVFPHLNGILHSQRQPKIGG